MSLDVAAGAVPRVRCASPSTHAQSHASQLTHGVAARAKPLFATLHLPARVCSRCTSCLRKVCAVAAVARASDAAALHWSPCTRAPRCRSLHRAAERARRYDARAARAAAATTRARGLLPASVHHERLARAVRRRPSRAARRPLSSGPLAAALSSGPRGDHDGVLERVPAARAAATAMPMRCTAAERPCIARAESDRLRKRFLVDHFVLRARRWLHRILNNG